MTFRVEWFYDLGCNEPSKTKLVSVIESRNLPVEMRSNERVWFPSNGGSIHPQLESLLRQTDSVKVIVMGNDEATRYEIEIKGELYLTHFPSFQSP